MTTGRINQVNGGASTRLRPFLAGQHRGPTLPPASKQHFLFRSESRLSFPTVARGAVPRTLGRRTRSVSSQKRSTPTRLEFLPPSSEERGTAREGGPRVAKGSYTPAPTEDPAGEQGIAPFSSIARGRSTPESCYPLIHIRRDERAGRDSEIAGARRYEHRL